MSGWSTIPRPTTLPPPVRRFITPGGRPASSRASTNFTAHSGVRLAGLNTTVQPAMSAAPVFQAGIAIGKFHGVMRPTGPTGRRIVRHILSGSSEGTVSPKNRRPSPAAYSRKSIASWTSPRPPEARCWRPLPFRPGPLRRVHARGDVLRRAERKRREELTRCRVDRLEHLPPRWGRPFSTDEEPVLLAHQTSRGSHPRRAQGPGG